MRHADDDTRAIGGRADLERQRHRCALRINAGRNVADLQIVRIGLGHIFQVDDVRLIGIHLRLALQRVERIVLAAIGVGRQTIQRPADLGALGAHSRQRLAGQLELQLVLGRGGLRKEQIVRLRRLRSRCGRRSGRHRRTAQQHGEHQQRSKHLLHVLHCFHMISPFNLHK